MNFLRKLFAPKPTPDPCCCAKCGERRHKHDKGAPGMRRRGDMGSAEAIHLPSEATWKCLELDCGELGNDSRRCWACASSEVFPVAAWTDRESGPVSQADGEA